MLSVRSTLTLSWRLWGRQSKLESQKQPESVEKREPPVQGSLF